MPSPIYSTGWKRFGNVSVDAGTVTNQTNLIGTNTGASNFSDGATITLYTPRFNSNSGPDTSFFSADLASLGNITLTGIEYQLTFSQGALYAGANAPYAILTPRILVGAITYNGTSSGNMLNPGYDPGPPIVLENLITRGGPQNLLGLDSYLSNLDNVDGIRAKVEVHFNAFSNADINMEGKSFGNSLGPAPAVRLYYRKTNAVHVINTSKISVTGTSKLSVD